MGPELRICVMALEESRQRPLGGEDVEVECDETEIGRRQKGVHGHKKVVKGDIWGAVERCSGRVILFIFDEPTTGLHFHDIKKLLASFNKLIEQGHSLLVIEHNTDVIKCADWLIDLGPEAGDAGGNLVYSGIPSGIKKVKESYTGRYL